VPLRPIFAPVTITTTIVNVAAPITVANGPITSVVAPPTPVVIPVSAPPPAAPDVGGLRRPPAREAVIVVINATHPDAPGASRRRVRVQGTVVRGDSAVRRRRAVSVRRRLTPLRRHMTAADIGWARRPRAARA
jgi:hypothetical protein